MMSRESLLDVAGKGVNTTRIIKQLGEPVVHLTQAGGADKATFLDLVKQDLLDVRVVDVGSNVRFCHTFLSEDTGETTEIVESGNPVTPGEEARVHEVFRELLPGAHTVVITGSKAPGFTAQLYPSMVSEANQAGARVMVDIRGEDLLNCLGRGIDVVKINVSEFSQTFLAGQTLPEGTPFDQIPKQLVDRMIYLADEVGIEIVLTNGAEEVLFILDGTLRTMRPEQVKAVNSIGCGDAMTAGIAVGLRRGVPIDEAIALGMDCARKNVQLLRPGRIL